MLHRGWVARFGVFALWVLLAGCGEENSRDKDGQNTQDPSVEEPATQEPAVQEPTVQEPAVETPEPSEGEESLAQSLGMTQYSGKIDPIEESRDGNETTYTFDPEQGPVCMRGEPYRVGVRETDSEDLVIFLQGGGACWSAFCLAVTTAPAGVPHVEILHPENAANPVADWNVVYLPYCDGSFFAGDAAYNDNLNNKGLREHRGMANLTAALEVAQQRFANPKRILLAGSSGGAYGLLFGAPLTRHYFPDAELIIMADSGIGLARDGDPAYTEVILEEFRLHRFLPEDCTDCLKDGHLSGFLDYFLTRDRNARVGFFSSWFDGVIATIFLQIPPEQFARAIENGTNSLYEKHPNRFRRFIVDGIQHTTLLGDPSGIIGTDLGSVELPPEALDELLGGSLMLGGLENTAIGELTMAVWLRALIEHDLETWVDIQQERTEAP